MARLALSILWGAALCGLGYTAVAMLLVAVSEHRGEAKDNAGIMAVVCTVAFAVAVLYTMSVADVFHFWDLVHHQQT